MSGTQKTIETSNPPVQEGSRALKKAGKVFYYGLALDSAKRSLNRSGRFITMLARYTQDTVSGIKKSNTQRIEPAVSRESICLAQDNAATGMIALFFVTIFFFLVAIWQMINGNSWASIIVALISLVYGFKFFVYFLIWRKAKNQLSTGA